MPHYVPPLPIQRRSGVQTFGAASAGDPAFSAPVRWVLRVLSWLAFGVASYLAWHAISQTSVAGCGTGSASGCDLVLNSPWSKWLGIPVAVLGLGCYAVLASLSIMLGLRNANAARWISIAFVTLSIAVAMASLWFIGVQAVAIGSFCPYCLVTDVCGIAIGAVATIAAVRGASAQRGGPQPRTAQPGVMALRPGMPSGARSAPLVVRSAPSTPSMVLPVAVAVPLVVLLVGGQLLFAPKTFEIQQVVLNDPIGKGGSKANDASTSPGPDKAEPHVTMRLPNETDIGDKTGTEAPKTSDATKEKTDAAAEPRTSDPPSSSPPAPPAKQRIVKVLGGTLSVDTYAHPIIGSPDAPHIVVEMVSYDCPHCHKMFPILEHALDRYGDQVALVIMTVPLDKDCNPHVTDPAASHQGGCQTARLAIAMSKISPSAFAKFHAFLMAGKEKAPPMDQIFPKAYVLSDRDKLRKSVGSDAVNKQLDFYVELFDRLSKQHAGNKEFGLPIQILGDYIMSGSTASEADVFKAWEQHLGVKPK